MHKHRFKKTTKLNKKQIQIYTVHSYIHRHTHTPTLTYKGRKLNSYAWKAWCYLLLISWKRNRSGKSTVFGLFRLLSQMMNPIDMSYSQSLADITNLPSTIFCLFKALVWSWSWKIFRTKVFKKHDSNHLFRRRGNVCVGSQKTQTNKLMHTHTTNCKIE